MEADVEELRAALVERDLQSLESQQQQLDALSTRDDRIRELSEQASRLRAQSSLLQLKLNDAEDRFTQLADSAKHGRWQHELACMKSAYEAARHEANEANRSLTQRDTELQRIREHLGSQQTLLRGLHGEIASLVSRCTQQEVEVDSLRAQVDKRTEQLRKAADALRKLRDLEIASRTELEALRPVASEVERWKSTAEVLQEQQSMLSNRVAELQDQLSLLQLAKKKDAAAVSEATTNNSQFTSLSRTVGSLQRERDALASTLETVRTDARREGLALQRLADERQRVIAGLQADLSAATSALSQLSSSAGSGPGSSGSRPASASTLLLSPASAVSRHDPDGASVYGDSPAAGRHDSPLSERYSHRAPSTRRRGLSSASAFLDTSSATASSSAPAQNSSAGIVGGAAGGVSLADYLQLRLTCESTARKLAAREERVKELEGAQADLLGANERLRSVIEAQHRDQHGSDSDAQGSGDGHHDVQQQGSGGRKRRTSERPAPASQANTLDIAPPSASQGTSGSATSSALTDALLADARRSEDVFAATRALLVALNRLFVFLRAQAEGRDAADAMAASSLSPHHLQQQQGGSVWLRHSGALPFVSITQGMVDAKRRFGALAAAVLPANPEPGGPNVDTSSGSGGGGAQRHRHSGDPGALWSDTSVLVDDVALAAYHAGTLREELADAAATEMGAACRQQ